MELPILVALISVSGTLLGTVTGGSIVSCSCLQTSGLVLANSAISCSD